MNAKNDQANRSFAFNVKGHCGRCSETVFCLDRKQVVHTIVREMPLPLQCGQCGSVRLATAAERSTLGFFLSEQTIPMDVTDLDLMYAYNERRAERPLAKRLAD
jgi:hypothetical protein